MAGLTFRAGSRFYDPAGTTRHAVEEEVVTCTQCGCPWMELLYVQQFHKHHNLLLGQKPPAVNDTAFWIFRCPKCGEIFEPTVQTNPRDLVRRGYEAFLNHMQKPAEEKEKPPEGEDV